jgi:hypothetical protein
MTRKPTPPTHDQQKRRRVTEDRAKTLQLSQLETAYAALTSDTEREAEAAEWCEAFVNDELVG